MNVNFRINPKIPLKEIHDSMQLDSQTIIAKLEVGYFKLKVFVAGDVKVFWNPNPEKSWQDPDAGMYKCASQMPDGLLQIFAKGGYDGRKDLEVCNNNWFEVTVSYKGRTIFSDVSDIEELDPCDLFTSLWDMYLEFKKDEDDIEKDFQETMKNVPARDGETEDIPAFDIINGLKDGPIREEDIHDLLAGTLFDRWGYPVGRLNDMHYKHDTGKGRYGGLIGA